MARTTVDVDVFEGTATVDVAYDRPVRLMPNGLAGIVYRDEVYPLYAGDVIRLEDEPLDKELCQRFLARGLPIPYWPEDEEPVDSDDKFTGEELGIGAWYLESSRLGHYLAFDASKTAAEQLAKAIDESGLGVVKLGESFRPADNGQRYDWYIRLKFRGSRDECLSVIEDLLMNDAGAPRRQYRSEQEETESADSDLENLYEIATHLVAATSEPLDPDNVEKALRAFGNGSTHFGYLSWRFAAASPRIRDKAGQSAPSTLDIMSSIIRDTKDVIGWIEKDHGNFLEDGPYLAQRAIDLEFERIDLEDSWRGRDDALRRARASLSFLRKAVILTIASGDYQDRLLPMLRQLKPPAAVQYDDRLRGNVIAAVTNLRDMATRVEELFSVPPDRLASLYDTGRAELLAVRRGDFDFLADYGSTPVREQFSPAAGELPFVILPPGERIQSILGDLRKSARYREREVDFGRLRVLTDLSELIGPERCTLYSGIFPSSGKDNGYMVLTIAWEEDDYGEDAIAISPWKHEHATYIVRPDCGSKQPWQTVFSQTKQEAIRLGARRLQFRPNPEHGLDEYEAMREKILALMSCDPDEFESGTLYFDPYRDHYVLREGFRPSRGERKRPADKPSSSAPHGLFQRIKNWFDRNVEM